MRKLLIASLIALAPLTSAFAQGSVPWHQSGAGVTLHQIGAPWHQSGAGVTLHQGSIPWHQSGAGVTLHQGSIPWHQSGAGVTLHQTASPFSADLLTLCGGFALFGGIVALARRRLQK